MNIEISTPEFYAELVVEEDEDGSVSITDIDAVVVTVAGVDIDISLEVAVNRRVHDALEKLAIDQYWALKGT